MIERKETLVMMHYRFMKSQKYRIPVDSLQRTGI